jgi:hypothetical protein
VCISRIAPAVGNFLQCKSIFRNLGVSIKLYAPCIVYVRMGSEASLTQRGQTPRRVSPAAPTPTIQPAACAPWCSTSRRKFAWEIAREHGVNPAQWCGPRFFTRVPPGSQVHLETHPARPYSSHRWGQSFSFRLCQVLRTTRSTWCCPMQICLNPVHMK